MASTFVQPFTANPGSVVPPASAEPTVVASTWFTANTDLSCKFDLPTPTTLRYVTFNIATASGNIQACVLRLTGTGANPSYTRVMNSGVIACPTAGDQRLDLGAATLQPGRYALTFWTDNTTISLKHSSAARVLTRRQVFTVGANAGGIPASGTATGGLTNRYLADFALEGDV